MANNGPGIGSVCSKCSESFYKTNMDDNGTYERYKNLILLPLLKIKFGNRMNRYKLDSSIEGKGNILSLFWDTKIDIK